MSYGNPKSAAAEPGPSPTGGPTATSDASTADDSLERVEQHLSGALSHAASDREHESADGDGCELATQLSAVYPIVRSLYLALAYRDGSTAKHSWRVAGFVYHFGCAIGLERDDRLALEVAGLLHDVGKIGVPDSILLKPASLTPEELAVMDEHHRLSIEIIRPTISLPRVTEAVDYSHAWFDGSRAGFPSYGEQIPFGGRMLSVADAFDAMTSDRVYRRAMPQEAALAELVRLAGRQFDPRIVRQFQRFITLVPWDGSGDGFSAEIRTLVEELPTRREQHLPTVLEFYARVLNDLYDGVCFVSVDGQVLFWNDAAEKLTGYSARDLCEQTWNSLEELHEALTVVEPGGPCPMRDCIADAAPRLEQVVLRHMSGEQIPVATHLIPIVGGLGNVIGVAQLFRDVRDKVELEREYRELASRVTQDPMTGLVNRAELDRQLPSVVNEHCVHGEPCSLIVADLDNFKEINDTYGHQCGDHVLQGFAQILMSHSRPTDLVARYGGEEFVLVLGHTPLEVAWGRAEGIRSAMAAWRTPAFGSRAVTASFGITELRISDTPESLLRRADRALYMAKQQGRNCSVKIDANGELVQKMRPAGTPKADGTIEEVLFVSSGGTIHLKLAGFAAAHNAEMLSSSPQAMRMRMEAPCFPRGFWGRKQTVPVEMTLSFRPARERNRVAVEVCIKPEVSMQSHPETHQYCLRLLWSLRAYLLAD